VPWSRIRKGDRDVIINGQKVTITERDEAQGLLAQRDFGAPRNGAPVTSRTAPARHDHGRGRQAIADSIPVHERKEALALIHDGQRCYGAIVRDLITGELCAYVATATAIATGGAGACYARRQRRDLRGIGTPSPRDGRFRPGQHGGGPVPPDGHLPGRHPGDRGLRGDGGLLKDVDATASCRTTSGEEGTRVARRGVAPDGGAHQKGKGVQSRFGEHIWLDITLLGEKHIHTNLREVLGYLPLLHGVDR